MKREINVNQASRLVNCGAVVLVTAAYSGKATITPCAWHMPVSKNPPILGVALSKGHFSSELIEKSREFIVNIPNWALLDKVIICGKCSGRNIDKFKESELTPEKSSVLAQIPKIGECIGCLECKLIDIKETGDHFLFLGEIIRAEAQENYFKGDFWDTSKVNLIFHLGGRSFFKSSTYIEFKS